MKHLIRSHITIALLAGVAFFATSCSPSKPENTVVGKWSVDAETKVTFTKEGKIINDERGKIMTGDYNFTGGNLLSLKMPDMGTNLDFDVLFSSENEMILTKRPSKNPKTGVPDPKMEPQKFTRLAN